ncbi:hypothetical protein C3F34_14215 [Acinetobacter sp. ACNIH2]|uniref:hypothetical protein n=1 Tax=Acinetobacter sp. ACNIH2 TaxID=1758189 RepID=UPI000CDC6CF2|nr:hypothetical protein [Acinetobacter sp. ACNIH2]AUX87077.1 hypothetical protein C3F34_14215 [Acinetobacter sp. ACNIH2]
MDLIIRFFVWVSNCFLSGKAQAVGIALFGVAVSYAFLNVAPTILKGAVFLYPNFGQYISEHFTEFQVVFFATYMVPTLLGGYIAFQQLKFIYYKESYSHF